MRDYWLISIKARKCSWMLFVYNVWTMITEIQTTVKTMKDNFFLTLHTKNQNQFQFLVLRGTVLTKVLE